MKVLKNLRSRNLFLKLWLVLYLFFSVYDMLNSHFGWLDPGIIFLTQLLALFMTTIAVVVSHKSRRNSWPWCIASIMGILIILFSYAEYYNDNTSIYGENSAHSQIQYGCVLGEQDGSVISIFGNDYIGGFKGHGLTHRVCVLTNLPLAPDDSLALPYTQIANGVGEIIVLISYEAILFGSFMLTRYINKNNLHS